LEVNEKSPFTGDFLWEKLNEDVLGGAFYQKSIECSTGSREIIV